MITIRDIIKRNGDFLRFSICDYRDGRFALIMEEKPWTEKWGESIRIEIKAKRLAELANDILSYLKKEAQLKEWKPTMAEFQWQIEQIHGKGHAVEFWFIDWVRTCKTKRDKEAVDQIKRIYEWLKSNEAWLYSDA